MLTNKSVIVKHQGKKYNVDLDPASNGETFKFQVFSLTNVEPERQKILVRGGQLKDDTELSKLGIKAGHTFMMMGTPSAAGSTIIKPKEPVKFVEDMTEAEAAQQEGAIPAGLQNLGNTCYMNATIQALKSIPELGEELNKYKKPQTAGEREMSDLLGMPATGDLTGALRDLFKQMSQTQDSFPPLMFLNALRQSFPQFAQRARDGHGYAQQDAEEAWSQVLSTIRPKLKLSQAEGETEEQWIDRYMSGSFDSVMKCDDLAAVEGAEEIIPTKESFLKLDCHITSETNS
jgi:ubiquitin carboxyl-terminal hydrolase 14